MFTIDELAYLRCLYKNGGYSEKETLRKELSFSGKPFQEATENLMKQNSIELGDDGLMYINANGLDALNVSPERISDVLKNALKKPK